MSHLLVFAAQHRGGAVIRAAHAQRDLFPVGAQQAHRQRDKHRQLTVLPGRGWRALTGANVVGVCRNIVGGADVQLGRAGL